MDCQHKAILWMQVIVLNHMKIFVSSLFPSILYFSPLIFPIDYYFLHGITVIKLTLSSIHFHFLLHHFKNLINPFCLKKKKKKITSKRLLTTDLRFFRKYIEQQSTQISAKSMFSHHHLSLHTLPCTKASATSPMRCQPA